MKLFKNIPLFITLCCSILVFNTSQSKDTRATTHIALNSSLPYCIVLTAFYNPPTFIVSKSNQLKLKQKKALLQTQNLQYARKQKKQLLSRFAQCNKLIHQSRNRGTNHR